MNNSGEINELNEKNNVYAYNIEHKEIHVSKAESGKKGYFCLGCEREMQAVISKKQNRISYFRHDPKAVKGKGKCTYSDESYRHKLAKDILQRTKFIKVPSLYKYPPIGQKGKEYLLSESIIIEAAMVGIEKSFFENENGGICWGKKNEVNEKYLLFRPDVTFFDKNNNPILLIEIVVTHKIKEDKLIKIKRLGINTVQVTIPKSSPEEIEKCFSNTNRIKWIYNYEQESSIYIQTTDRDSETLLSADEIQRKLFEESFTCRKAEIAYLIRIIKECMESKQ